MKLPFAVWPGLTDSRVSKCHLIVKCRKANVTRIKINKTFHTADSFASSADKKQGTLSHLTHCLSVIKTFAF